MPVGRIEENGIGGPLRMERRKAVRVLLREREIWRGSSDHAIGAWPKCGACRAIIKGRKNALA